MIPKFSLHTHTTYCDGKNSAEEMVQTAITLGCDGIGFSGHSCLKAAPDWTMSESDTLRYISEITHLREKYADRIEVLLGIEYDANSSVDTAPYDYVIGSVHISPTGGFEIDHTAAILAEGVKASFDGDFYAFAADYYDGLSGIKQKTSCDIVGHFDLIMKFNEGGVLFDENDARYRDAAFSCLEKLKDENVIFEINTGAMARGYRKEPYPSRQILKRMVERGCKMTLTTDAHSVPSLLFAYDDALHYARACGVKELYFPKNKEFIPYQI